MFLAIPFLADWRWLRDRDDSPWYPTIRLFRQTTPGDWSGVFERIAQAVQASRVPSGPGRASGVPDATEHLPPRP